MNLKQHLTPVKIAIALSVLLVLWMLIGDRKSALNEAPEEQQQPSTALPQVQVRDSNAQPRDHELVLQGQLEPWQQVAITAQVSGHIEAIFKHQGDEVKGGQPVLQITDEGRSERLAQARATLKLRERELVNAQTLERSDFVAQTEISRFESDLAEAKATEVERQLAVEYNTPAAPFDGVINKRHVDPGEWVSMGTPLMDVVQVKQLRATAFAPQQQVSDLKTGQPVKVELLDGRSLDATISFVSYSADAKTRSYLIEVLTPNPEQWRISGASVTLRIELPQIAAHQFSPALLSLNESGQLGVKVVNEQNIVQFYPVKTLAVNTDAAIVAGLPETVRLITLGAGFVEVGQHVQAVEAEQ